MTAETDVTQILKRISSGEESANEELYPIIYDQLRAIARGHMRAERAGHTLETTALVNEACIRLLKLDAISWADRAHFLKAAAGCMRRVLVDHARRRDAAKRGSDVDRETFRLMTEQANRLFATRSLTVLDLHRALERLAVDSPRAAEVVELVYFGGLTHEEAGQVLGVTRRTVDRDWRRARLWLLSEIDPDESLPA